MSKKIILTFVSFLILIGIPLSEAVTQDVSKPPTFSKESGFYDSEFKLTLSSSDDSDIYYTIDGSDPTTSNTTKEYTEPILIKDRTQEPNIYSEHQAEENSPISIAINSRYKKPGYLVDKAMVVRAVTKNSSGYGKVVDKIYFITDKDLSQYKKYTVVSLVTNEANLFDPDTGIYVAGNSYLEWRNSSLYDPTLRPWDPGFICNYYSKGKNWEKEASMTIFEQGSLTVDQKVGIRVKGHASRGNPQKCFNIYARKSYGASTIHSPELFPDNYDVYGKLIEDYETFSLRSVSDSSRLKDKLASDIIKDRNCLATIHSKSSVLFLNGEYWGYYTLMEKISADTFSSQYNMPQDEIIVNKVNELEDGTQEDFDEYRRFADEYAEKDLTNKEDYLEVSKHYDFDSMIDHYVAGIYLGVHDWPNRNFGMWRYKGEKVEGNPYTDGKWRFISFDFDLAIGMPHDGYQGYEYNNFKHMMLIRYPKFPGAPTNLFLSLIKNKEFRNRYINVYCDYRNEVSSFERLNVMLDEYKKTYSELLANSQVRWGSHNETNRAQAFERYKNNYENGSISDMKLYFKERGHYAYGHIKKFFELDSDVNEITIIKKGEGKIQINSITPEIKDKPWKGKYFSDIPISITAIASEKSKFKGWKGDINSNESTLSVTLSEDMTIEANFEN